MAKAFCILHDKTNQYFSREQGWTPKLVKAYFFDTKEAARFNIETEWDE